MILPREPLWKDRQPQRQPSGMSVQGTARREDAEKPKRERTP